MKFQSKYIIPVFFGILLIVLLYSFFKNRSWKEGAENIPLTVGNYTCRYFHELAICILKKEDFEYDLPDEDFIKYLPSNLPYKYDDIHYELLENGIDLDYFEKNQKDSVGTWSMKDDKNEKIWIAMKPLIQPIFDNAFLKSDLKKHVDYPVIHFRCADTPFSKHFQYHFQKYEFYKNALEEITKKIKKYDKVIISYCNTHGSDKQKQEKCDVYLNSLENYLQSIGYESIVKCQSNLDDFATLYYAPAVISTGSSYSFMSGYFGKGVFISGGHQNEDSNEIDGIGNWLYKGYNVMHSEVPDYYDTDNVIKILSK